MTPGEAPEAIKKAVQESVRETNHKTMQKAFRVSNAMRNSVIEVLTNPSPSPPGSPPGVRSGFLRRAWKTGVRNNGGSGGGVSIVAYADAKLITPVICKTEQRKWRQDHSLIRFARTYSRKLMLFSQIFKEVGNVNCKRTYRKV